MRIAVVLTEVSPGVGGRFTFQDSLVRAVEGIRPETRHEFVFCWSGYSRYTEGPLLWRLGRLGRVGQTLLVRAWNEMQDGLFGKRVAHIRSHLERKLDRNQIDLVWFPTQYAEDVDRPYIATVLDLAHRLTPWFPEVSVRGEWERRELYFRRYLAKATAVIVTNETGRREVEFFYQVPASNCIALPHPTPERALEAAASETRPVEVVRALGVPGRYLLYPAQFWPHKNHAAALDAMIELHRRGDDIDLVLVGSDKGQKGHVREQIRERGLDDCVHLLGFVSDDELVALYQHAHALVFVSRFGPENLPPLEAFALGCPAVVGEVPGAYDQLGDAALVVNPFDAEALADAVQRLADPAERIPLIEKGRRRAISWRAEDYVRGVVEFIDEFERERRLWT